MILMWIFFVMSNDLVLFMMRILVMMNNMRVY